ncbi:MAG: hypothetical protein ACR2OY_14475, partial [Boseongicola sp.]
DNAAENINDAVSDVLGTDDTASNTEAGNSEIETPTDTTEALATALTVDGFDPEMLRSEIEDSDLGPVERLAAKVLVDQAEADPGQIESVIKELRESLNVE